MPYTCLIAQVLIQVQNKLTKMSPAVPPCPRASRKIGFEMLGCCPGVSLDVPVCPPMSQGVPRNEKFKTNPPFGAT